MIDRLLSRRGWRYTVVWPGSITQVGIGKGALMEIHSRSTRTVHVWYQVKE